MGEAQYHVYVDGAIVHDGPDKAEAEMKLGEALTNGSVQKSVQLMKTIILEEHKVGLMPVKKQRKPREAGEKTKKSKRSGKKVDAPL